MRIYFSKYQAIGNDFLILDLRIKQNINIRDFARRFCNRNFGIGADGVLTLERDKTKLVMRIFNSDGSEAEMSGNGIRCLAKYIFDNNIDYIDTPQKKGERSITLETKAGTRTVVMKDDKLIVDMGKVEHRGEREISIKGKLVKIYEVSSGNPHSVIFTGSGITLDSISEIGHFISNESNSNVEIVETVSEDRLSVRVWERGVGETLGCGTGASAVFIIANKKGYVKDKTTIGFKGGDVEVGYSDKGKGSVYLSGTAEWVFNGFVDI